MRPRTVSLRLEHRPMGLARRRNACIASYACAHRRQPLASGPGRRWQPMRARLWPVAAVVLVALCACARSTPEQRLRATVSSLQAAIEARDAGDIRTLLADDFVGPEGLDREGTVRMAQAIFLRHRGIGATVAGPLQVRMQPDRKSTRLNSSHGYISYAVFCLKKKK